LNLISIIAAIDQNYLIGNSNHLPWNIKEDLHFFRRVTMGHPVVMGKRTWLSIGKPLDGRVNVILTHDRTFNIPGCLIVNSVEEVISQFSEQEIIIIGGAEVFRQFLPYANNLYLTKIKHAFTGDTYFPQIDWNDWNIVFYEQKDTESGYQITFEQWTRKSDQLISQ